MVTKNRRVKLEKGKQREIILDAVKNHGSLKNLSVELNIPYRTLKGYAQEERFTPENLFNRIKKLSSFEEKKLDIIYLDANWGAVVGGKKGIRILEAKYPEKIVEWRRNAMKIAREKSPVSQEKEIKVPDLNEKLAEFIGVYLGDGTLTRYFIKISGDSRYDKPYFYYLRKLISELFGLEARITQEKNRNTMNITIFSKKLCSLMKKEYGLNYGHKIRNRTRIPRKILNDEKLAYSCLRGLIDTDGSISRRGRQGSQFCIQFTSHNKILLKQVNDIGKKMQVFTFGDNSGAGTNKWDNIIKYFRIVGSSNLRHIVRFNERLNGSTLYQRDVLNYYQKDFYRCVELPFKVGPVS